MKRKHRYWLCVGSLLQLISLINSMGCGCGGYEKFTLKEGIAHLSFQYPSRYEIYDIFLGDIYLGARTTIDLFTAPLKAPDLHDAQIWICVYNADENAPNSSEEMESYISFWSRDEGFRIIERSSVMIAGMQGTQIVYYRTSHLAEPTNPGIPMVRTPVIERIVFFDYNNQIWRVSVIGHESLSDTIKADFEHIIDTFKILK